MSASLMETSAFGQRLKAFREAAGLTQAELAERAGVSQRTVSHIEQGRNEPTWSTVVALATALKVKPNAFLDESDAESETASEATPEQTKKPRGRPKSS